MQSPTCSELVEVLGLAAAMKLARHFPGYKLPVPKSPGSGYVISTALTEEEVGRMIERYSGQQVRIPVALARYASMTERNAKIRERAAELAKAGDGAQSIPLQISREESLSYDFVRNILGGWDPEFPVDAETMKRQPPELTPQMELL